VAGRPDDVLATDAADFSFDFNLLDAILAMRMRLRLLGLVKRLWTR
jgi:hypothetical protein